MPSIRTKASIPQRQPGVETFVSNPVFLRSIKGGIMRQRWSLLAVLPLLSIAGCQTSFPPAPKPENNLSAPNPTPTITATPKPLTEKEQYLQIKALYDNDAFPSAIEKSSTFLALYPKSQYRERVVRLKRDARRNIPTPDPDIAKAREVIPGVSAFDSKVEIDSSYITIHGTLINNRAEELSYVHITYRLTDKSGAQIGTASDVTSNLQAGGKWRFKATGSMTSDDIHSYSIADLKVY